MDRLVQLFPGDAAKYLRDFCGAQRIAPVAGAAAFGAAIGVMKIVDQRIHIDVVRIQCDVCAGRGGVQSCGVVAGAKVAGRAASAWRQKTASRSKFASEKVQLALSVLTLVLLAVESFCHLRNTHHF